MKVILTFDYELFFGEKTGTVEICMIQQTNELLRIARKFEVPMVFFVDMSFVLRLNELKSQSPQLEADFLKIQDQIKEMRSLNCEVQLHIHPHWMNAEFRENKWIFETKNAYKLSDYPKEVAAKHFKDCKDLLENISGQKVHVFRAGGWCIQPFSFFKPFFLDNDISIDSSVFPGGKFLGGEYNFDFTTAPKKPLYKFEDDVCREDPNGSFTEAAISGRRYSPLFYWRLYLLGRLNPAAHKMLGDGRFLSQPGRKKSVLTNFTNNHVSTDGYYASALQKSARQASLKGDACLITIGHPKCNTVYSLKKLEEFIKENRGRYEFVNYSNLS